MSDIEAKKFYEKSMDAEVGIQKITFDFNHGCMISIEGLVWVDTVLKGQGGMLSTNFSQSFSDRSEHGEKLLAVLKEIMEQDDE